jgi:hypothetical protein
VTYQRKINAIKDLRGSRLRHLDFAEKSLDINGAAIIWRQIVTPTNAKRQRMIGDLVRMPAQKPQIAPAAHFQASNSGNRQSSSSDDSQAGPG